MTTTTVYPDAHPESSTVDGYSRRTSVDEAWDTIHDGAGNNSDDTGAEVNVTIDATSTTNQYIRILRYAILFDTSGITDTDVLDSATVELTVDPSIVNGFGGGGAVSLVTSNPLSNTAVVDADYGRFGATKQAADVSMASMTADDSTYNVWTLNSTGEDNVDFTGITKFGLRQRNDVEDSEPTWADENQFFCRFHTAEEVVAGDKRPKLVVIHAAPTFTPRAIMF